MSSSSDYLKIFQIFKKQLVLFILNQEKSDLIIIRNLHFFRFVDKTHELNQKLEKNLKISTVTFFAEKL